MDSSREGLVGSKIDKFAMLMINFSTTQIEKGSIGTPRRVLLYNKCGINPDRSNKSQDVPTVIAAEVWKRSLKLRDSQRFTPKPLADRKYTGHRKLQNVVHYPNG